MCSWAHVKMKVRLTVDYQISLRQVQSACFYFIYPFSNRYGIRGRKLYID